MIEKNSQSIYSDDVPLWIGHRNIVFPNANDMLQWVSDNKQSMELSDMIFDATIECHKDNHEKLIVATLICDNADVDIITYKDSFDEMITIYVKKLLDGENYEKLAEIKSKTESVGLTFPKI